MFAKFFPVVFGMVIDLIFIVGAFAIYFFETIFSKLAQFLRVLHFIEASSMVFNGMIVRTLLSVGALFVLAKFCLESFKIQVIRNLLLMTNLEGQFGHVRHLF